MDFGAQRTEGCFVLGDPGKISTAFNSYLKIGDFSRGSIIYLREL